jgi:hypothetical protein
MKINGVRNARVEAARNGRSAAAAPDLSDRRYRRLGRAAFPWPLGSGAFADVLRRTGFDVESRRDLQRAGRRIVSDSVHRLDRGRVDVVVAASARTAARAVRADRRGLLTPAACRLRRRRDDRRNGGRHF